MDLKESLNTEQRIIQRILKYLTNDEATYVQKLLSSMLHAAILDNLISVTELHAALYSRDEDYKSNLLSMLVINNPARALTTLDKIFTGDIATTYKELLRANKPIEAVKRYRQVHGCGLREAKDYIDALRENMDL